MQLEELDVLKFYGKLSAENTNSVLFENSKGSTKVLEVKDASFQYYMKEVDPPLLIGEHFQLKELQLEAKEVSKCIDSFDYSISNCLISIAG